MLAVRIFPFIKHSVSRVGRNCPFPPSLPAVQVTKMPKKTLDVQVTTLDAVLEFSIEVRLPGNPCLAAISLRVH